MGLGAFFGPRDARLRHREPEMGVGTGIIVGVAGRAGAGEHGSRREDVQEGQRRLGAPEAERPSEEAGQHLFDACTLRVVRARINAYAALCARRSMRAARAPARWWHSGFLQMLAISGCSCHSPTCSEFEVYCATQSMRRQSARVSQAHKPGNAC